MEEIRTEGISRVGADDEYVGAGLSTLSLTEENRPSYSGIPFLKTPTGRRVEGGLGILLALSAVGLGAFTDCDRATIAIGYSGVSAVLDSIN